MAAKKIIGYDAMGNPIYEGGKLPTTNTAMPGVGKTKVNTAMTGVGKTNAKPAMYGMSGGPAPAMSPSTRGMISSKNAPRNLQGAPQATALKILGADPATPLPTQEELDRLRGDQGPKAGGGKGGDPYTSLLNALRGLGDYAANNVNSSMDALMKTLGEQSNPYAGFQAQNTSTTPELAQLLQSQGVSQDPLQQYAAAINAQNMGQANAFQNQANTMRDIYGASQRGSIEDAAQQRADLLNQLQGNVLGAGKTLFGKKAPQRNSILNMILEAMKVQR